jgi:hypothetical protein
MIISSDENDPCGRGDVPVSFRRVCLCAQSFVGGGCPGWRLLGEEEKDGDEEMLSERIKGQMMAQSHALTRLFLLAGDRGVKFLLAAQRTHTRG